MEKKRILIVDDENDLCDILKYNLEAAGYEAATRCSAEDALLKGLSGYDLVLLDVMMEGISGFQLADMMRNNPATSSIPIIFITAKDNEEDVIRGLETGAYDYIRKPFSVREVILRVGSVLRRTCREETPSDILVYGRLSIDTAGKKAMIDGKPVDLTKNEFEILTLLASHPGAVFSREEILKKVWPEDVIVIERTVDVSITHLRRKLGEEGKYIYTRHGYGYCFECQ